MKACITALHFDPYTLPMPPSVASYSAIETRNLFIFFEDAARPAIPDFTTRFSPLETGYAPNLPDGNYKISIKVAQDQGPYILSFAFLDEADNPAGEIIYFDAKAFFQSFSQASSRNSLPIAASSIEEFVKFEKIFSEEYLKDFFSETISGNGPFWKRFYRDLDVVTAPLGLQIKREMNGERAKIVMFTTDPEAFLSGPLAFRPF